MYFGSTKTQICGGSGILTIHRMLVHRPPGKKPPVTFTPFRLFARFSSFSSCQDLRNFDFGLALKIPKIEALQDQPHTKTLQLGCFLEAFSYLKPTKKHPFEGVGRVCCLLFFFLRKKIGTQIKQPWPPWPFFSRGALEKSFQPPLKVPLEPEKQTIANFSKACKDIPKNLKSLQKHRQKW